MQAKLSCRGGSQALRDASLRPLSQRWAGTEYSGVKLSMSYDTRRGRAAGLAEEASGQTAAPHRRMHRQSAVGIPVGGRGESGPGGMQQRRLQADAARQLSTGERSALPSRRALRSRIDESVARDSTRSRGRGLAKCIRGCAT